MKHFTTGQWCDFVRKLSSPREQSELQSHLDDGCEGCLQTLTWLRGVADLAAADAAVIVPADVVARALSIFPASPSDDWVDRLQILAGQLVTEMNPDFQLAGVRSLQVDSTRLLFRAGVYAIDLSVEFLDRDGSCGLVGQITNERDETERVGGALVQVVSDGHAIAEAETNEFGEFLIEQPEGRNSVLRIALRVQNVRIDLPLQNNRRITELL